MSPNEESGREGDNQAGAHPGGCEDETANDELTRTAVGSQENDLERQSRQHRSDRVDDDAFPFQNRRHRFRWANAVEDRADNGRS
jgi:hypothetical protein